MYLDPLDSKEPMFKAAVRLLHNHGESLDPLQVLEVPNLMHSYTRNMPIHLLGTRRKSNIIFSSSN